MRGKSADTSQVSMLDKKPAWVDTAVCAIIFYLTIRHHPQETCTQTAGHGSARPRLESLLFQLGHQIRNVRGHLMARRRRSDHGQGKHMFGAACRKAAHHRAADLGADQVETRYAQGPHQTEVIIDYDIQRPRIITRHRRGSAETAHVRWRHNLGSESKTPGMSRTTIPTEESLMCTLQQLIRRSMTALLIVLISACAGQAQNLRIVSWNTANDVAKGGADSHPPGTVPWTAAPTGIFQAIEKLNDSGSTYPIDILCLQESVVNTSGVVSTAQAYADILNGIYGAETYSALPLASLAPRS